MVKKIVYEDIRAEPGEKKAEQYNLIDYLYKLGNHVEVKEHRSGFPAITIDCCEIHIISDILTLEAWSVLKHLMKQNSKERR
jgi:hypothetical protein